jgi:hypothetical protein
MSSTYTIRIPRDLKEKMEQNPEEEWSVEIRNFLEERVKQVELMKTIKQIESRAEKRTTKADSTLLIREDREH